LIVPPGSQLGPIASADRTRIIAASPIAGHYEQTVDRESAYEHLKARTEGAEPPRPKPRRSAAKAASLPTFCSAGRVRAAGASRKA
jgi:hypothetical protein